MTKPFRSSLMSKAFTLIELLIVISIVGVLAAILIPAVGMVRERSKLVSGVSTMRNVGVAISMYANENGLRLPHLLSNNQFAVKEVTPLQLAGIVAPYLGFDPDQLDMHDPVVGFYPSYFEEAVEAEGRTLTEVAVYFASPYVSNGQGSYYPPFGYRAPNTIDPAKQPLVSYGIYQPENQVALIEMDATLHRPDYSTVGPNNTLPSPPLGEKRLALYFDWHVDVLDVGEDYFLPLNQ
ncbi:type II secretion system protein [Coraliomargarita sp. W4R53]